MAKSLKILHYPNPILTTKASDITEITEDIKTLAKNMLHTMKESKGIGLAANQVGILQRIIVVDIDKEDLEENCTIKMPLVLINPTITKANKEIEPYTEGCLSFPELQVTISRPQHVHVTYTDLNGSTQKIEAKGLFAICLQHEIDHLDGIVFVNKVSPIKKDVLLRKYNKYMVNKT